MKKPATEKKEVKTVEITLRLDSEFINLLRVNATLGGWAAGNHDDSFSLKKDPLHVIGFLILSEARGQQSERIYLGIPPEWRRHLDVVADKRRVFEGDLDAAEAAWDVKAEPTTEPPA